MIDLHKGRDQKDTVLAYPSRRAMGLASFYFLRQRKRKAPATRVMTAPQTLRPMMVEVLEPDWVGSEDCSSVYRLVVVLVLVVLEEQVKGQAL